MPIVLPPTEFEDRSPLYEDVRLMLAPGFLSESVVLNGHRFALRTLTTEDFFLLRYRAGMDASDVAAKSWLLASAIWMVNGQIVAGHQAGLLRLHRMCETMPVHARDALYRTLLVLTRRMQIATLRIEAYLYEVESRFLWKGEGLSQRAPVRVGINRIQHLWAFYNTSEDQRERDQFDWAMTKFIAGTQAPKGIQKLNAKEQRQEKELERKRQRIKDRMFYTAHDIPFPKDMAAGTNFLNVNPMETEADLAREMARWIRGEKDWHDRIIDFVKGKLRRSVEERRAAEETRAEELARIVREEASTGMEVLSPEAAAEFLAKSRMPRRVFQDQTHNSAYDKYLANPEPGSLEVDPERGVPRSRHGSLDSATLEQLKARVLSDPIQDPEPEESLDGYLSTHPPTVKE